MKILLLENHAYFAKVVIKEFLSSYEVKVVPSIEEAKKVVSEQNFDVVLCDYDLDDGKGDEFLGYLKEQGICLAAIAISSHQAGNVALVKAGAFNVCSKMEFRKINAVLSSIGV